MIRVNKDKTLLTHTRDDNGEVRVMPISCYIRDHASLPDAHPENANGALYPGFYQPIPFPSGKWIVTKVIPNDDAYTAPFFIATNAHQSVTCLDGSVVEDYGYGIHFSTSPTTWGCLKLASESDARWLGTLVKPGESVIVE